MYAFAGVDEKTGEVTLPDAHADKEIQYPGDEGVDGDLYGNLKALYLLKKEHRHLKVLLSIGGWRNKPDIETAIYDEKKHARLVKSAVRMVEDYGFDGLDMHYEIYTSVDESIVYLALLANFELRLTNTRSTSRMATAIC
ncbi:glycoside hydrolase superfamily [Pterulicium gracile]|uniref:Glycoside hydrolase superfamily n=1 Tax=Pterulicium gracile TaxID=1884261 RepID=A0A5C3QKL8_9AGAR|nr:glycoside hydrolase superfamily [Pterula gracilis]